MVTAVPLAREGYPFIFIGLGLGYLSALAGWSCLAVFWLLVSGFCGWFFRDPERHTPADPTAVISPADGKVIYVGPDARFPGTIRISIFMNVFNVHVNRAPIAGRVREIRYHPGKFLSADLDKASEENERNTVVLVDEQERQVIAVQVAGLIARRIVCYLRAGDQVTKGQRIGLIRFGSRLEVYLPQDSRVVAVSGRRVTAGETILGYLNENKEKETAAQE
ncbi:MAG: phosphatidylserine decarboxylase family protein [Deltaproteobacteria bacterium]|nr:phosphatidylserine decarboxylase family protein [Deltaproteobacteria bacterium]